MGHQRMRLLRTSLIVRGLDAGGATRPLGYAFSILRLGCAAITGFRGRDAVRIRLGDSRISSMRVDHGGAIGSLGYSHPIRGLGSATVIGLGGGHPIRIRVGNSGVARVRVNGNGSLTIAANSFATPVLDAVPRK